MFWLHVLNRSKIAQCEREGITADDSEEFAELGDGSPLYRCVQNPFEGEPPSLDHTDLSSQIHTVNMCPSESDSLSRYRSVFGFIPTIVLEQSRSRRRITYRCS